MGLVRLRGRLARARAAGRVGGTAAVTAARTPTKPCIRCVFAGRGDIGYGAAHALAPCPRAGAPHIEGSSLGETKNPANRRPDRGFDRAPRHVSAHRLRNRRLVAAHTDAARAREPVPAGRSAAPAGRRAAGVAPPAAPDRPGPRHRDRLPRGRRRRARDGARGPAGERGPPAADRRQALRRQRARAVYYMLGGDEGPSTASLDVGAASAPTSTRPSTGRSSGSRRSRSAARPSGRGSTSSRRARPHSSCASRTSAPIRR